MKQIFTQLVNEGMAPNDAAVKALAAAMEETLKSSETGICSSTATTGTSAPAAPAGASVSRALMRTIFTEFVDEGMTPTDAAVKAIQEFKKRCPRAEDVRAKSEIISRCY